MEKQFLSGCHERSETLCPIKFTTESTVYINKSYLSIHIGQNLLKFLNNIWLRISSDLELILLASKIKLFQLFKCLMWSELVITV